MYSRSVETGSGECRKLGEERTYTFFCGDEHKLATQKPLSYRRIRF
jgi:hypothetical protein